MAANRLWSLVVHLVDGGTEGIPVKPSYRMPDLTGVEYLVVPAADRSVITIPVNTISKLHLKPPQ